MPARRSLPICNDFEQRIADKAYRDFIEQAGWSPPVYEDGNILADAEHVRINDLAAAVRAEDGKPTLATLRWSFPPAKPGYGPVFNFRSEGRQFSLAQRCIVPASAFYEFTAPEDPKQKKKDRWRFERTDGHWMGIAGLWRPGQGNQPPVFTLLTCEPGPDVAPLHNRQIVILEPQNWKTWLLGGASESELLRPSPAQTLAARRF